MPPGPVIPELPYPDAMAAAQWLSAAFGFSERLRIGTHRIQMRIGTGSIVVVEGDTPASSPGSRVLVPVDDVDTHFSRAVAAGASVSGAPITFPFGERQYTAVDPGGHRWTFSQSVADSDPASWGGEMVNP